MMGIKFLFIHLRRILFHAEGRKEILIWWNCGPEKAGPVTVHLKTNRQIWWQTIHGPDLHLDLTIKIILQTHLCLFWPKDLLKLVVHLVKTGAQRLQKASELLIPPNFEMKQQICFIVTTFHYSMPSNSLIVIGYLLKNSKWLWDPAHINELLLVCLCEHLCYIADCYCVITSMSKFFKSNLYRTNSGN